MKQKRKKVTDSAAIALCKNLNLNYYKSTFYGFWIGWCMSNKICGKETIKLQLTSCLAKYYDAFEFPKGVLSSDSNGYPYSLNCLYKEVTSWKMVESSIDNAAGILYDKKNTQVQFLMELGSIFFIQLDNTIANIFIGFYMSNPTECMDVVTTDTEETIMLFCKEFKFLLQEIDYLMGRDRDIYFTEIINKYLYYKNLRSTWYDIATEHNTPNKNINSSHTPTK